MKFSSFTALLSLITLLFVAVPSSQAQRGSGAGNTPGSGDSRVSVLEQDDGTIVATDPTGTYLYADWNVYFASPFFMRNKMRCGQPFLLADQGQQTYGSKNDCAYSSTNPKSEYDPAVQKFSIPVVVHILMHTNGNGAISDAMVQSQIDILNEDFMALPGTNGSPGTDCQVEFYLATVDPNGNATTGITRTTNNNWYNDSGNYKSALYWNTNKYFNIYTNTASGYLGYAYMPQQGGVVGSSIDGVVCNWRAFGRNSPFGPPYNQDGRRPTKRGTTSGCSTRSITGAAPPALATPRATRSAIRTASRDPSMVAPGAAAAAALRTRSTTTWTTPMICACTSSRRSRPVACAVPSSIGARTYSPPVVDRP